MADTVAEPRRRKICVVTGTRAEYGLLKCLMEEILAEQSLQLQLAVTGMHLSSEFGSTYRDILDDGFEIDAVVETLLASDTPAAIAKSMGLGIIGFADAFQRLAPDVVVVLGDRYEMFAAAQAALVARIPLAHLHGGEVTEGAIDEAFRHALTKMASLHFTAHDVYSRRVLQLGEDPARIYTVGALSTDAAARMALASREDFQRETGFPLGRHNFLVTYHPVTLDPSGPERAMTNLLTALDEFPEAHILFTGSNADTEGRTVRRMIEAYVAGASDRCKLILSLGQRLYFSAMKHFDAVIGNSSSGLIEAPIFQTATVDIGPRQAGRLRADSVIHCEEERVEIVEAIRTASSTEFRRALAGVSSPYGSGDTARRIVDVLRDAELDGIQVKRFRDLPTVS